MLPPRFARIPLPLRLVLAAVLLTDAGCNNQTCPPNAPCPTPTPGPGASCSNMAGTRNMFWSDDCDRSGRGTIVIAQVGCSVNAAEPSLGTITGIISGTKLTFTLALPAPCGGSASGTATISGGVVSGTYTGTQSAGSGCCSTVTGRFTFDYSPTPPPTTPTPTR